MKILRGTEIANMNESTELKGVDSSKNPTSADIEVESSLIRRAKHGDNQAFCDLLRCHDKQVMQLILRFSGDLYIREDLYQEIFMACYKALPKFKGNSSFRTWLYRISLNRCISYMKKNQVVVQAEEIACAGNNLERSEQMQVIYQALSQLRGAQRISFHLFYIEQWNVHEIAQLMECSTGTVKSHLDRARKRIRLDSEVAKWQSKN
ncbi:MAG: hypothetical protein COC19_04200 [SAR86 cluster bacterium]|uniref:RNA polymerase subunit sigma-70 n=1 Tax=SAR86 cluster bacterium TaxID=2030880 RepID=A0A2A4MPV6_9GAMM|nr:MAG: hypothetical protein COC19_04200 [SAR86 cluster bacterium]